MAAVFAVHPLHVESVAWVMERKDVLSALFYLSAALVWVRFTEAPDRRRYCLAHGLFTAGLLSKSIVVTLPAALLVRHWWKNGRVTGQDVLRLAPFFAVGLAITGADLAFYTSREPLDLGYSALAPSANLPTYLRFELENMVFGAQVTGVASGGGPGQHFAVVQSPETQMPTGLWPPPRLACYRMCQVPSA